MRPSGTIKPTKHHYNKFLKRCRGIWVMDTEEPICEYLKSTIDSIRLKTEFLPREWQEAGVMYGVKQKLIALLPGDDPKRYKVVFTEKGLAENRKLQMTTDAFTGKRVRSQGGF